MDDLRPPAPRTSSRTLAIVVVAVLVAIAVAGIVIAALRGRSQAPDAGASAAPAASGAASRPVPADLTHVAFSADSDQLSPLAVDQIRALADSTKDATSAVVLSGKIEATSDRAARMELAKKRINVMRRALQANGISPGRVRIEIAEYPVGRVPASEADIIEMNLR
jgi:outer membrane protein OmpA-like peptidoglycan-associated protein